MFSGVEFVMLADALGSKMLRQSLGVNRKTGYKWLDLYRKHGEDGLKNALGARSRALPSPGRPRSSNQPGTQRIAVAKLSHCLRRNSTFYF